jgi:hypothetical protein
MSASSARIAWHYTTGIHYGHIVASGELRPAAIGVKPPEKPVLWFSLNQDFEPTACKAVRDESGAIRRLSKEDTQVLGEGLYRFGVPARLLHPWPKLARKARMTTETQRLLEREGIRQGANPILWCGLTSNPIPLAKCVKIQRSIMGVWTDCGREVAE